MSSNTLSRLMLPAMISMLGLGITQAWYMKTGKKLVRTTSGGEPLAILTKRNDIIERRPTTRIIWESLNQGEQLFGGEAVRTGSQSSGKITFIKSGMTIGLEPDSLVIIEESNGELQLNLVNGGVFVKNEDDAVDGKTKQKKEQPTLKAGDKKIVLGEGKSSEMNLSISDSGAANIQVRRGDVKIADKKGATETVNAGSSKSMSTSSDGPSIIDVRGPRSGSSIPILGINDMVDLTWTNVSKDAVVFFEKGQSRSDLTRTGENATGSSQKIRVKVTPGDFFWRLVAVKDGKVVALSPTTFNQGLLLEAPRLLSFQNGEKIVSKADADSTPVQLVWTRPQGTDDVTVYLARDPDFKNILTSKVFASETDWSVLLSAKGLYYWQASAKWPGIDKVLVSSIGSFTLSAAQDIPVPSLELPLDGTTLSRQEANTNGLVLVWGEQVGVESYQLMIDQVFADNSTKQIMSKTISSRQFRLTNIPAGTYSWAVAARVGTNQSKPSAPNHFKIIDVTHITIREDFGISKPILFESPQKNIPATLAEVPPHAKRIRFKIVPSESDAKDMPWLSSTSMKSILFRVPKVGMYKLLIEAVDNSEKVVGRSDPIEIIVKEPELLPAPVLLTGNQKLTSDESGNIMIKWKAIAGADRYVIELAGDKGKFHQETRQTAISLKNLMPGELTMTVRSVAKSGRQGIQGPSIKILVPSVSNIAAPTTKGIKIR